MKTTFLVIFFINIAIIANAQFTEPGQKVLSSSISLNTGSNNISNNPAYDKGTSFIINAGMGKFIKKNVLSSFTLSYLNSVTKQINPNNTSKNITTGFFGGYRTTYYKRLAKDFYFGIGGGISLGYNTVKGTNTAATNMSKSEGYQIGLGISPILSYQLTNRFVINLSPSVSFLDINYNYSRIRYIQANQTVITGESKSFNLNTGFWNSPLANLSFGFSYLLKKK